MNKFVQVIQWLPSEKDVYSYFFTELTNPDFLLEQLYNILNIKVE